MDVRKPFLRPFKKLKDKLQGGSRKRDGRSGSEDSRKGNEGDVGRGEASQGNSFSHPEVRVEGAAESGSNRGESNIDGKKATLINANPPTSVPSISHIGEPDSV